MDILNTILIGLMLNVELLEANFKGRIILQGFPLFLYMELAMLVMEEEVLMAMRYGKLGLELLFNTSQILVIKNQRCISLHGGQPITVS